MSSQHLKIPSRWFFLWKSRGTCFVPLLRMAREAGLGMEEEVEEEAVTDDEEIDDRLWTFHCWERVPWAVEMEVCKKMFSLKLSSWCAVATEGTFHSFGLKFSRWWHHASVSLLMWAEWKFPDLARFEKDMAAAPVAPMITEKNVTGSQNVSSKSQG